MKKKIFGMLSLLLCLMLSISLVACGDDKHEAKEEWKYDSAQHWHECAAKDHDDRLDVADHRFDAGTVTQPTETEEGVKTFTCADCGYKKTESIARLEHTHKFDETRWETDETKHWHKATCEHDLKGDEGDHAFTKWTVTTPAGYGTAGEETSVCDTCGYTGKRTIAALDAKENSVTVNPKTVLSKVYDGKNIALSAEDLVRNGDGAITISFRKKGSEDAFSAAAPKNAGTYTVKVSVAATAEWKACETTFEYTVTAKPLTAALEKTYDGKTTISGAVTGAIGGEQVSVRVTMTDKNVTGKIQSVELEGADKDNYTLAAENVSVTIHPIHVKSVETKHTKAYDGTPVFRISLGSQLLDGDDVYLTFEMSSQNAGTTTILDGSVGFCSSKGEKTPECGNYTCDTQKLSAEILKKKLVFEESNIAKEYDGTERYTHTFTEADGLVAGDECTYSFDVYDYYGKKAYLNAGTYTDLTTRNESVSNDNYAVEDIGLSNPQGTSLVITKKVLSGLKFVISKSKLEGETGIQEIERTVIGTNGTVTVRITFNIQSLTGNGGILSLTTGTPAQDEAKIEFITEEGDAYENCEFAASKIGSLLLVNR